MVMGSLLGSEAYAYEQQDQQQFDPFDPFNLNNQAEPQPSAPTMQQGPFNVSTGYNEPAPAPAWYTSPSAQNLLSAPGYSGDVPMAAPDYTGLYGPAYNITPGEQQVLQAQQDIMGNLGGGAFGVGNVTPGDVFNYVANSPALDLVPGGGVVNAGLGYAGVDTPTVSEVYNQRIPVVSDFMQNTVQPIAGDIGAAAAQVTDPFGVGSYLSGQLGGPSAQDVGRFAGQGIVPVTVGDFAVNAATAGGVGEALTGLPIDDLARAGARNLGDYAVRDLFPNPMSFERNAGRDALSQINFPAIAGAAMSNDEARAARAALSSLPPEASLPRTQADLIAAAQGDRQAAVDVAREWLTGIGQNPEGTPSVVLGRYERTMAQIYPETADPAVLERVKFAQAADARNAAVPPANVVAASGGRISPDSPAARMGAPLAYDPQFMTPPPADAAMRDLGLTPQSPLINPGTLRPLDVIPSNDIGGFGGSGEIPWPRAAWADPQGNLFYVPNGEHVHAVKDLSPENMKALIDDGWSRVALTRSKGEPKGVLQISVEARDEGRARTAVSKLLDAAPPADRATAELSMRGLGSHPLNANEWLGAAPPVDPLARTDTAHMYGPNDVAPGNLQPGQQIDGTWSGSGRTLNDVTNELAQSYSSPAGYLPERATPPLPATPSVSPIDQLIHDAITPTVPTQTAMTLPELLADGRRLGVDLDYQVLQKGTEYAKSLEYAKIHTAQDLESSIQAALDTEGRALNSIKEQNAALGIGGTGNATPSASGAIPDGSGGNNAGVGGGGGGAGAGGNGSGATGSGGASGGGAAQGGGTPPAGGGRSRNVGGGKPDGLLKDIWRNFNELEFFKFGGDLSALRQTVGRSMNVLYLPDTIRSFKASIAAIGSPEKAIQINDAIEGAMRAYGADPKMADWRTGADWVNRESGVSKFGNMIPGYEALNRGYATMLNAQRYLPVLTMLDKNPHATADLAQHIADYSAISGGRGTFGKHDKEIAGFLGPIMTSARMAASWPERMAYLIPVQKVGQNWTMFGPTWQMAMKEQGGMAVTGLGVMALSAQLGGKVNYQTGDISFGDKHYNIWGGGYGWVKMAHDVYTGTKNGKEYPSFLEQDKNGVWKGSLAEFFRNKIGPSPSDILEGMKVTGADKNLGIEDITAFLRPDNWDKGVTGKDLGWFDRASQVMTFLWVQDMAKFIWEGNEKPGLNLETAARAAAGGVPAFLGIGVGNYPGPNPRTAATNQVMSKPENLSGLPPNVAAFLQDKSWNEATSKEQQAILDKLSPEERDAIAKGEQQLRDQKDIFQLSRDETKARSDLADQQREALKPLADKLLEDWKTGAISPDKAVEAIKRVEARADKEAQFTSNVGPKLSESKGYQDAIKNFSGEKSDGQKEVDRIREIQGKYYGIYDDPRVTNPDGTKNWDKIEAAQKAIMDALRKTDPGFANRVEFNLQKNPGSDYELTQWISKIDDRLNKAGYYDVPSGQKTAFARSHPDVDALLSAKYGNPVHTEQAAKILVSLLPERKVTYAK